MLGENVFITEATDDSSIETVTLHNPPDSSLKVKS